MIDLTKTLDSEEVNRELEQINLAAQEAADGSVAQIDRMKDAYGELSATISLAGKNIDLYGKGTSAELNALLASLTKMVEPAAAAESPLDKMISELGTYEQKRQKTVDEYAAKRKLMQNDDGSLRQGVTQAAADELSYDENTAITAVDTEFAKRQEAYQVWMDHIAKMSLDMLQQTLAEAEAQLAKVEESGGDPKQLAMARAQVAEARKKVEKAQAQENIAPGKAGLEQWGKIKKSISGVGDEMTKLGKSVGGTAGEVLEAAGNMSGLTVTMIDSIVQVSNLSTIATKSAIEGASKAAQTAETASVILIAISAAIQVVMAVINLFNNDKQYEKRIEELGKQIKQLEWERKNLEVSRLKNNGLDVLETLRKTYKEVTAEVIKLHLAEELRSSAFLRMVTAGIHQNEILEQSAQRLAAVYANMKYTDDKALGINKYKEAEKQLESITRQQLLIQGQIDAESSRSRKKQDPEKIAEWQRQIQELGAEAVKIINDLTEGIMGGSSSKMAEDLGTAFIDAFKSGEDAAAAWGAKVDDIVAGIIRRMLIQKLLEEPLGEVFNKYKAKWFKDNTFVGFDGVNASMADLIKELNDVGAVFGDEMDKLPEETKKQLGMTEGTAGSNEGVSSKGFAAMSQDTGSELNGRFSDIQAKTGQIMAAVELIRAANGEQINQTFSIREIMIQLNGNVADIRTYTKVLPDIKVTLTSMDRKLDNL